MILQIPILIKPYLAKYLAHYCQITPSFKLTQKDRFGAFLINALRHKSQMQHEDKKFTWLKDGEKYLISIPDYYELNYGFHIGIKQQYWFNKFLQEDFQDRMLMHIAPQLNGKKGTIKPLLMKYREKFGICEDDLPYKTMEKMWERNRHKIPCFLMN